MGKIHDSSKTFRMLNIFERLNKGEILSKDRLSLEYDVNQKTIQRDIEDLRCYIQEKHYEEKDSTIKYDRELKGYKLIKFQREWLTNEEIMAVCKIILESRAFCKDELDLIIKKLLEQSLPEHTTHINKIIKNE